MPRRDKLLVVVLFGILAAVGIGSCQLRQMEKESPQYAALKDGKAAADALRAPKLEVIRDRRPPAFWAPFVLIGE